MMNLYNTISKKSETFKPQKNGIVSLYTCGPTVYDYTHIGNWFAFIRWDILARTLRQDYKVIWVMNITDVGHLVSDDDTGEDKLEKGAKRENKTAWDVAEFYTKYFNDALNELGFDEINIMPRATDHIDEQLELVKILESKGYTYVIEDGVYFDTSKLKDYGKLTNLKKAALLAGARVEMCPGKKHATDFALWKFSPKDTKRDMAWDSPWGKGFPGWHIECSAMSMKYLGNTLDIHCGGIDHIAVHHTNEIAQSEAATGNNFANYWVHSNFVLVDGKKMSKSLGNLFTLEDLKEKGYSAQDFRMLVIESHYRSEAQFTWEVLNAASNRLKRWQATADLIHQPTNNKSKQFLSKKCVSDIKAKIIAALNDDLNTPKALLVIDQILDSINFNGVKAEETEHFKELMIFIHEILGINLISNDVSTDIKELMSKREQARKNKDWQLSDELRNKLKDYGVKVRDTASGQIWERI